MGLRQVAAYLPTQFNSAAAASVAVAAVLLAIGPRGWAAEQTNSATHTRSEGAQIRVATYDTAEGPSYFAASIQPSADEELLMAARSADCDIAIVVDTSATQAGDYRKDSLQALHGLIRKVRDRDRIRLFAGDVGATDLSQAFDKPDQTDEAIAELTRRLPLGNTNLLAIIDSVRAALVARPPNRTRSIVYIGDGTSIDAMADESRFAAVVDALRADRIAIHSIAIGPATNLELMAVLANQTGGMVATASDREDADTAAIGSQIALAATMSPIWLDEIKLLGGMQTVQQDRLPPLRLDRDSILLGSTSRAAPNGVIQLAGSVTNSSVKIVAQAELEESHPDFAFLAGLVDDAAKNDGLRLPTAGSPMLRETARMLVNQSEALTKTANIALQQGDRRGAKAVVEMALKANPNNVEAEALQRVTGNRLVLQNDGQDLDDIFGGAEEENPFGGAADAPAPAAGAGADPLALGDDAPAAAAPPTAQPAPATPPQPAPVQPAPIQAAPAAGLPAAPPAPLAPGFANDPVGDDELLEASSDLLDQARQERRAAEGRLRATVTAAIRAAHRRLRNNPIGVAGSLKSLLATVETTPDINPELRQDLESQVRSAIQTASRMEAEFTEAQATLEQVAQGAAASAQLLQETFRREATLKTLSQQINALIDEGRYTDADGEVSLEFARIAGDSITRDSIAGRHFTDFPLALQTYDRDRRSRERRERNFVDAFSLVLESAIPFVDEPPIQYPEADVWIKMSRRRLERYGAIELIGDNETERRIQASLSEETTQSFDELPLAEAVAELSETHDIPIVVDSRALEEIGLSAEEPITIDLKNVSLRSFLRLMLRELDLTYLIKDEVMQITTVEVAEENLVNKVYPVGDLVIPIFSGGGGQGGGGGFGGGGGGFGGGGGGFGGGGGGFGGGGGGGFGGGGGGGFGGGGQFAVPDDISLASKESAGTSDSQSQDKPATTTPDDSRLSIRLTPKPGQSFEQAWIEYLSNVTVESAQDLAQLDQRIRSTVRWYSARASRADQAQDSEQAVLHFGQARDVIAAAIRTGHAQSWMYHVYAIALKATHAPSADIERALLSAVDFAESPEDLLNVAARLEDIGSDAAAIELCKRVSALDPYRREPYAIGLRLAKRLDRVDDLAWATKGILSQAWPDTFQSLVDAARLEARAVQLRLVEEGRQAEAEAYAAALKEAVSHDVIVRVSWTGDADIDLSVEEPSGTICSLEHPTSAGGGTLIGDAYPGSQADHDGTVAETYLCPEGFSGQYRLLVRRVWGNVSTGHATIEILTDVGRQSQRLIKQQLPLMEKDALVLFEVKEGKRREAIADAQLAHLQERQRDIQNDVVGQVLGGNLSSGQVLTDLFNDVRAVTTGGIDRFGRRGGAVGFRPEITTLSEGAQMAALAIISADRRYVRISPFPSFSQIGDVTTFNFVSGETGVSQ